VSQRKARQSTNIEIDLERKAAANRRVDYSQLPFSGTPTVILEQPERMPCWRTQEVLLISASFVHEADDVKQVSTKRCNCKYGKRARRTAQQRPPRPHGHTKIIKRREEGKGEQHRRPWGLQGGRTSACCRLCGMRDRLRIAIPTVDRPGWPHLNISRLVMFEQGDLALYWQLSSTNLRDELKLRCGTRLHSISANPLKYIFWSLHQFVIDTLITALGTDFRTELPRIIEPASESKNNTKY